MLIYLTSFYGVHMFFICLLNLREKGIEVNLDWETICKFFTGSLNLGFYGSYYLILDIYIFCVWNTCSSVVYFSAQGLVKIWKVFLRVAQMLFGLRLYLIYFLPCPLDHDFLPGFYIASSWINREELQFTIINLGCVVVL